jgi:LysR family transcriptional regulator, glycine cleavage system transcriptional activator
VPFAWDGIDVAIRRDDFAFPAWVEAELMMKDQIGPVCSPGVAQSLRDGGAMAQAASFLGHHPLLHTKTRRPFAWSSWAEMSGVRLTPGRKQTFEHFYFSLQAAAAAWASRSDPRSWCSRISRQAP